jgi:CheY-like chemotaxis protein
MKDTILLALKDEEDIRVLTEHLVAFELRVAMDGASAIEAAVNDPPSLIVADIDLPVVDGGRVFKILRRSRHTSTVPFLFVSDTAADLKGFRVETDTFLRRPFNPEEASGRIRQVLLLKSSGPKEVELVGKLSQMGLPDIIQFLQMNGKEGELKITGAGASGILYIQNGEIHDAVIDGIEKEKALYRLLGWPEGEFEFVAGPVQVPRRIHTSTSGLLMEGMRQLDELKNKAALLPDRRSPVRLTVDEGSVKKGLAPEINEIVKLLKIYSRVGDLVDNSSWTDYEVFEALSSMLSMGIIEVAPVAEEAPGLFTIKESMKLRERISGRFPEITNYARVFLIATGPALVSELLGACAGIPGFTVQSKTFLQKGSLGESFGEVAKLVFYGGMELVIFSVPTARKMGPLLKAFSTNLVGLMVLMDALDKEMLEEVLERKKEVLSYREVPVAYILGGTGASKETGGEALGRGPGEPLFILGSGKQDNQQVASGLFRELLGGFLNAN